MTQTKSLTLTTAEKSRFLGRCYGWMALALLLSAVVAYFTAANMFVQTPEGKLKLSALGSLLFSGHGMGFMVLCILEIVVVIFLTAKIRTMSVFAASLSYVVYSVLNGLTLSSIFAVYEISSIANAFLATAVTFGVMCFYGSRTKSDLTKLGRYCIMGLWGIILASLLHFILMFFAKAPLSMLDLLISIATVLVFTGLTAFDSQKIVKTAENAKNTDDFKKVAIMGALELYLDFINILLALLKIFGKRKD
ncbi:Bax inhibitor-1/YccA family protein [uncultured Treponema sp.]|uniref:Bax inhibitor-1/YccA family protein n=1 Tax=uncultured Treponema sp. TaxID=162155 RepID=UPI0015BFD6CF|nr:Bax inhibitor-1/YccA family protein [uncultured Treponema sp.]